MTHDHVRAKPPVRDAELVAGPGAPGHKGAASPEFGGGATTLVYLVSGHGRGIWNFASPLIQGGSRVVASASEYSTAWNVDRKIGDADIEIMNIAPVAGRAQILMNIDWGNALPVCVTLFVDP